MGKEVKYPLRAQSKYGLMGSSAKTGKNFIGGSQEHLQNRIILISSRVIEFWCFRLPAALRGWGVGGFGWGVVGGAPHTCMCMHTHTNTHMHAW